MRRLIRLASFSLLALFVAACGSDAAEPSGQGGSQATDDGLYHPPPNGVHKAEDAACDALMSASTALRTKLKCVGTAPTCPTLVRRASRLQGSACHEYDEGALKGCADYYGEQATCDDLRLALDRCAVVAYPCEG
jgi:hypothetical protein